MTDSVSSAVYGRSPGQGLAASFSDKNHVLKIEPDAVDAQDRLEGEHLPGRQRFDSIGHTSVCRRFEASAWKQPVDDENDLTTVPGATGHDTAPDLSNSDRTTVLVGNRPVEFFPGRSLEPLFCEGADLMEVREERSLVRSLLIGGGFDRPTERVPLREIQQLVSNPVVLDFRNVPKQPGDRISPVRHHALLPNEPKQYDFRSSPRLTSGNVSG